MKKKNAVATPQKRPVTVRKRRNSKVKGRRAAARNNNNTLPIMIGVGITTFFMIVLILIPKGNDSRDYAESNKVVSQESLENTSSKPVKEKIPDVPKEKETVKQAPKDDPVPEQEPNEEPVAEPKKEQPRAIMAEQKPEKVQPNQKRDEEAPKKGKQQLNELGLPMEEEHQGELSLDQQYEKKIKYAYQQSKAAAFLEVARWCKEHNMEDRMKDCYRNVIKFSSDNQEARSALGYITKIRDSWVTREEAARLGYYEYQGKWLTEEEIVKKGLAIYENQVLTKAEARKQGLVEYQGKWLSKDELGSNDKKNEVAQKQQVNSGSNEPLILNYQKISITAPEEGKWSLTHSASGSQAVGASNSSQNLKNGFHELESDMKVSFEAFSYEIVYTFADGSNSQGDNIQKILQNYQGSLRNMYRDVNFSRNKSKKRYQKVSISHYYGTGIDKKNTEIVFDIGFFKHSVATYCIFTSYPKKNDTLETRKKIFLLLNNIRKIKS